MEIMTANSKAMKYWDRRSAYYDTHQDASKEALLFEQQALNNILSFLPAPSLRRKILDAGGGSGRLAVPIARLGYCVTLTDISEKMVTLAKRRARKAGVEKRMSFRISDLENMRGLEDNFFDLSFSEFYPVSYCSRPEEAVRELARVTRKNGMVIISVCNKAWLVRSLAQQRNFRKIREIEKNSRSLFDGAYPCTFYDEPGLKKLVRGARLEIVKITSKNKFIPLFGEKALKSPAMRRTLLNLEKDFAENPYFNALGMDLTVCAKK